jgi:hypothetical protein
MSEPSSEEIGRDAEPGEIGDESIAKRAYEISQRDDAATSEENWQRAEHELRDDAAASAGE